MGHYLPLFFSLVKSRGYQENSIGCLKFVLKRRKKGDVKEKKRKRKKKKINIVIFCHVPNIIYSVYVTKEMKHDFIKNSCINY